MNAADRLKELRKEINSILDKGLAQFLLPYSDIKEPMYIYVQAYTPSFNDGEPCEHRSYAMDKYSIGEEEILKYEQDFFGKVTLEDIDNSVEWPEGEEFLAALDGVEEALEYKYGTDYQVLITLKDGNVSFVRDHYDCGF